jgi:excinuclease ABC subunit C
MTFNSQNFLENVGEFPGVYQMHAENDEIIYVGKAKNLKKRLSSYFRKTGLPIKTQALVAQIHSINVTLTHTENEALILEHNLIKQHKPRYNVLLRDSKSYPYIRIDDSHEYPSLTFYRGDRKEKGRYFGPYPNVHSIRETLKMLQKVLPVRQCDDVYFSNRSRPCLQYQIKRCTAPCVGHISKEKYSSDIDLSALFLQGKDKRLNNMLVENMEKASKELDFETAAIFRDRINALKRVQSHQSIDSGSSDIDILSVAEVHGKYCVEVTFVRGGRHSGSRGFFPKVALELTELEVLAAFIPQHYFNRSMPKEIILSHPIPDQILLAESLSDQAGHKVQLHDKVRGAKKEWLKIGNLNVVERLNRHLAETDTILRRFDHLQQELNLDEIPERIECFDISHTQGNQTVASCVVFSKEGAVKRDYRLYNIKGITPGDDYAAMRQVLTRRYEKMIKNEDGKAKLPSMVLIDGGKGQLGIARDVFTELQLNEVLLIGVAKGEGRKPGLERLFVGDDKTPVVLGSHSSALHLVQQIRDEAHRFAISGHRAQRGKAQTQSVLQQIPGVGNKRRQTLLKHFGGIQGVQQAGVKDLAQAPGISVDIAEKIYYHLQKI